MINQKNRNIKAVVLAAGIGSRINEITKSIPKTMIKITYTKRNFTLCEIVCIWEMVIRKIIMRFEDYK